MGTQGTFGDSLAPPSLPLLRTLRRPQSQSLCRGHSFTHPTPEPRGFCPLTPWEAQPHSWEGTWP